MGPARVTRYGSNSIRSEILPWSLYWTRERPSHGERPRGAVSLKPDGVQVKRGRFALTLDRPQETGLDS
jgi:hypothetical protein